MKAISLFTGAGGLDLGLAAAGIHSVVHVELDRHAQAVLRHHWPDTPIHNDVTTYDGNTHAADLVHGGSPCTDLSVAGRRAGLAGTASGLYWHQVRIWRESGAPWFLWENVAGALSSQHGADFAAVLWGITGTLPDVPAGGWRSMGFAVGPRGCAVWRLLDGRWFGVPQRRRRVFVVGRADGDLGRAIPVLLDAESVQGNPPPSRDPWQDVAALTAHGVGTCGADDNQGQAGHLIPMSFHNTQDPIHSTDHCHSLGATSGGAAVMVSENHGGGAAVLTHAVRRLMPVEAERLMGWPDDWTATGDYGNGQPTEIADSHRYRMCGNGVIANMAEWIGHRVTPRSPDRPRIRRYSHANPPTAQLHHPNQNGPQDA